MTERSVQEQAWQEASRYLFGRVRPSSSPVLLSVGAQPGAGKTMALESALRRFYPNEGFVQVVGDDLRRYHPDFVHLSQSPDPEVMPRETAELSGWLVGQALAHAAQHGYSTVVEGTLRRPETTLATVRQFAQAGASTHLVVLGVSAAESWTGCVERYLGALEAEQAARWTPLEAHDAGLAGTPRTLRAAEGDPAVHRISVVDRAGTVHYDNVRGTDGRWREPARAVMVLEELRQRPADPQALAARIEVLSARADRLGAPAAVRAGVKHARELARRGPAAAARTRADVLGAVRGQAHDRRLKPRTGRAARRSTRGL